jgi:cytochrome P450
MRKVRSVLTDSRFSSRGELMRHHPLVDLGEIEVPPAPPGEFLLMDEPQHSRYRKPLVGRFTVRRMRLLTERVEQITAEHLDAHPGSFPQPRPEMRSRRSSGRYPTPAGSPPGPVRNRGTVVNAPGRHGPGR